MPVDHRSDADLVADAAARIAVPRDAPTDSFLLHAPLELLARAALLPHVHPAHRSAARARIAWLADAFEASGDPLPPPAATHVDPTPAAIAAAIDAGDVEQTDALVCAWAAADGTTSETARAELADAIADRTAAAGHGAILLWLLAHDRSAGRHGPPLLRRAALELAERPDWRLAWVDDRPTPAGTGDPAALQAALLGTPDAGDPGSTFIHPTMSLVDRTGLAADLLTEPTAGLAPRVARTVLQRVAAWSMLQEPVDHAPYGWTHALTMPQATVGIAGTGTDPGRAVAVAATWLLGFRATIGTVSLDPTWVPDAEALDPATVEGLLADPDADPTPLLALGPSAAAATVWHADAATRRALTARLVSYAAAHEDAHLAKYALAALDAASTDPTHAHIHHAALAHLAAIWHAHPTPT